MARGWGDLPGADGTDIGFAVAVKDPAPDPAAPPEAPAEIGWDLSPIPIISSEVKVINNMITFGTPCANVTVTNPLAVYGSAELPDLRPQKLYTAIFTVRLKRSDAPPSAAVVREVLRYPFQTSRYASFAEQVNSWRLKTNGPVIERAAVFALDFAARGDTPALAAQALAGTLPATTRCARTSAISFDRLVHGVFELAGLHPAATTEWNAVRDRSSGRIYGSWSGAPSPSTTPRCRRRRSPAR